MKHPSKSSKFFWITNITKKAHHIDDLGVIIYPMRSLNLLDTKHNNITEEQLINSAKNGSLFKKKSAIIIRQVPPGVQKKNRIELKEDAILPTKKRSAVELDNIKYEELEVSDDTYAEENAELAEKDYVGKWKK